MLLALFETLRFRKKIFFFTGSTDSYPIPSLVQAAAQEGSQERKGRESFVVAPTFLAWLAFLAHAGHPAVGELNLFMTRKKIMRCKAINWQVFQGVTLNLCFWK